MTKQSLALSKVTTSTWGATFSKARHIYSAVVRPAMSYGSTVWHSPPKHKDFSKLAAGKLSVIQNKCLRTVSGACVQGDPNPSPRNRDVCSSMTLHLKHLQIKARYRLQVSGQSKFIAKSCKRIAEKPKNQKDGVRKATATPGQQKADSLLGKPVAVPPIMPRTPHGWRQVLSQREQHSSRKKVEKIVRIAGPRSILWAE